MVKVLIIGWDGATWEIAEKLIKEDKMPNLKRLLKHGLSGELESSIPPWTVPAWNIMSTGLNPGKLGFATFFVKQGYEFKPYFLFKKFQTKRNIWDILSQNGKKVIVANLPNVHVAYKVNGCMISGWLFLDENSLTYPPDLKQELDKVCEGYEVDIVVPGFRTGAKKDKAPTSDEEYLSKSREILEKHFKAFEYLLKHKEWDFAFLVFAEPDRVQHRFWENKKVVEETYKILDQKLGYICNDLIDNDTIVFLVSDHGFGTNRRILNINEFLIKNGYLKLKENGAKNVNYYTRMFNFFVKYKLLTQISRKLFSILPEKIRSSIIQKVQTRSITDFEIDWENTKCYGYGVFGDIYLNVKGRDPKGVIDPKDYERVRDELIEQLSALRDPKTGKPLKVQIFKREELYNVGVHNTTLPDLVVLVNEDINGVSPGIGSGKILTYGIGGNHRLKGIFLAYGPGIKEGYKLENIRIYDITPTILHIFGLPIPNDMEGKVLIEIFEENSEFAKREPKYIDASYYTKKQEDEKLKNAVKNLKLKGKL